MISMAASHSGHNTRPGSDKPLFFATSCAVLQISQWEAGTGLSILVLNQVPSCEGTSGSQYTPEPIDFWGVSSRLKRSAGDFLIRCYLQLGNWFFNHSCSWYGFKSMMQLWSWPWSWVNSDLEGCPSFFWCQEVSFFFSGKDETCLALLRH